MVGSSICVSGANQVFEVPMPGDSVGMSTGAWIVLGETRDEPPVLLARKGPCFGGLWEELVAISFVAGTCSDYRWDGPCTERTCSCPLSCSSKGSFVGFS
jgi:hypothetical protein